MIHYAQIPDISEEAKMVLDIHLNEMFMSINSFMIAMAKGLVPKKQIPPMFKNSALIQDPSWAVPVGVRKSRKMNKFIRNLVKKVFDKDKFYETSMDERYILAKIMNLGIQQEESVMKRLYEEGNEKALKEWIQRYKIKDKNDRQIVLQELEKINEKTDVAETYLASKNEQFKNQVIEIIGEKKLLCYEYPFALTGLFSDAEWEQVIAMQIFEEIVKK